MSNKRLCSIESALKANRVNINTKLLCLLVSAITIKDKELIKFCFQLLKSKKIPADKVYEAILQTYLFCGFPAAIEALIMFHEYFPRHNKSKYSYKSEQFLKAGKANCKLIYGSNYEKLIAKFKKISPEMEQWMLIEGYGKVFNRSALRLKVREALNVCMLAVNYYPRQLFSHIKGCKNAGFRKMELLEIIDLILPIMAKKYQSELKALVNNIFI